MERVKELEHSGFQFEAADGSFELLMRKEAGEYEPLFRLESCARAWSSSAPMDTSRRGHDQDLAWAMSATCARPRGTVR